MILNEYIEQTSSKKMPVLFGENVVLVPFFDVLDMDRFIDLHRKDKKGYMCRFSMKNLNEEEAEEYVRCLVEGGDLFIWNVCPVEDQKTRLGFIYLTSVNEGHSVSVNGIMDKAEVKKYLKKDIKSRLTFADDATLTIIQACFDNGFERVEGDAIEEDREAIALHKRLGFKQEGILRNAANIDGKFHNVVIASIIKEDIRDGKE